MRIAREVRTVATEVKYQEYLKEERSGCPFCFQDGLERKVLKKFQYWYVTENLFPYDRFYRVSHMLIPFRHLHHNWELTDVEQKELVEIHRVIAESGEYDEFLENFPKARTQIHHHLHLLAY